MISMSKIKMGKFMKVGVGQALPVIPTFLTLTLEITGPLGSRWINMKVF